MNLKTYMKLICVFLFIFQMNTVFGQNRFGEILPPDFEQQTIFTEKTKIDVSNLPNSVDLSLKLPPAANQNPRGTCWAFASAYSLVSYIANKDRRDNYFLLNNGNPDFEKIMSPELPIQLYFEGIADCDQGAYSADLLKRILKEYGSVSWKDLPYSYQCNRPVPANIKQKAKSKLYPEYEVEIVKNTDLTTMKQVLASGQPLLLSVAVDDNFSQIPNYVTGDFKPLWNEYGNNLGGHAMTIVGYDDSVNAVKVLNSWGKQWGNQGYVWISYKILNNNGRYFCYPVRKPKTDSKPSDKLEIGNELNTTSETELSSWLKAGYYRKFDNLRIGLAYLNSKKKFGVIDIRENNGSLITSFYIELNWNKQFFVNGTKYSLTFDNVGNKGLNVFKQAMFFTIKKK